MKHYNLKRYKILDAGYVCFNGAVLNQAQCNSVNQESAEINRYIDAGLPVTDEMLNRSNYAFKMAAGLYK